MSDRRDQFTATVVQNAGLCREHHRLVLALDHFPSTQPGQFVQLSCQSVIVPAGAHDIEWDNDAVLSVGWGEELLSPQAYLRRPFSLAGRRDVDGRVELDIIHRVVGLGTDWLAHLDVGNQVGVLGPLGNRFALPQQNEIALMVGGGVGIPPMIYLAESLMNRPAIAFAGALTRDLLPLVIRPGFSPTIDSAVPSLCIEDFARYNIPSVISTDDGSFGFRGYVTQALEQYLDSGTDGLTPIIYTCGPELMMKRVAQIAADRGLQCQVAVERAMACGMGTCQSCCIRVRKPDKSQPPLAGSDWCWRLACTDGPVFQGADLLW
jgi:dihydroorotate dehydrogenase electron transfer subunit